MGTFEILKAAITAAIRQNGNGEITGDVLQQILISIVSNFGDGATFTGVAVPTTNPGTPDNKVFYLAAKSGVYPNFGGLVLDGELAIISNRSGTWRAEKIDIATTDMLDNISTSLQAEIRATIQSVAAERARAMEREDAIEAMFTQPVVEAINAWLEAHPEATTSVLDNSISMTKLTEDVKQRIDYAKNVIEYPGATFTQKLQAAIDDTIDNARIFFIPPGDYTIEQRIIVPANARPFKLMGQPSFTTNGRSIITCPNGFMFVDNVVSVEICDLALVGNDIATCIEAKRMRWLKLNRLFVRKFDIGIVFDSPYGVMNNVEVNSCRIGVQTTPIGTVIRECHIHGNTEVGIKTTGGNSLLIDGVIMEQTNTAAHIEVNDTDGVVISGCYIGDDSAILLRNNDGTRVIVSNLISTFGGNHELLEVNGGQVKLEGWIYNTIGTITINSGVLDISETRVHLSRKHINNVGGTVIGKPAEYMVGYTLHQAVADETCPITFWGLLEDAEKVNFAGDKVMALNSQPVSYNPTVDVNKPGIKYHFRVPRRLIGKQIYLNIGIDRTPSAYILDCWIVGCTLNTTAFERGTYNVVTQTDTYTRIRPIKEFNYWSLPVVVTSEDIYISICNYENNKPRDIKFMVNFVYLSEDNTLVVPPLWKPDNKFVGTTAERPTEAKEPGFMYFDTTLSKPIYWSGTAWVDASGNVV